MADNVEKDILKLQDELTAPLKNIQADMQQALNSIGKDTDRAGMLINSAITGMTQVMGKASDTLSGVAQGFDETAKSVDRASESMRKNSKEAATSEAALKRITEVQEKAHKQNVTHLSAASRGFSEFSQGIQQGTQIIQKDFEKTVISAGRLAGSLVELAAQGRWYTAGLQVLASVWGIVKQKANEAAEAQKKAALEAAKVILEAAEKAAKEAVNLAEKGTKEREDAEQKAAAASAKLLALQAQLRGEFNEVQAAQDAKAHERRIELLRKELGERTRLYDAAKATREGTGPLEDEKLIALRQQAMEQAKIAKEAVAATLLAAEKEAIDGKISKELEEQLKVQEKQFNLHTKTVQEYQKLAEATEQEGIKARANISERLTLLHLSEEEKKSRQDQLRIDELRKTNRITEAKALEAIVAAERAQADAKEKIAKAEQLKKNQSEDTAKANEELNRLLALTVREEALAKDVLGYRRLTFDIYDKYAALVLRGANAEQATAGYAKEVNARLKERMEAQLKSAEAVNVQSRAMIEQARTDQQHAELTDRVASLRERGFAAAAAAKQKELDAYDREREKLVTIAKQKEEMRSAVESGNAAEIAALERKHQIELDILDMKRKQRQTMAEELALLGKSVEMTGSGGTRTNYGIQDRRDARRKELRERNLLTEERGRGAFGSPEGSTYGGLFGSMGAAGEGARFQGAKKPDPSDVENYLGLWNAPTLPKLPEGLSKPDFDSLVEKKEIPALPQGTGGDVDVKQAESVAREAEKAAQAAAQVAKAMQLAAENEAQTAKAAGEAAAAAAALDAGTKSVASGLENMTTKLDSTLQSMADGQSSAAGVLRAATDRLVDVERRFDKFVRDMQDWRVLLENR